MSVRSRARASTTRNCTGAFCTVLTHGLGIDEEYVEAFLQNGR